MYSHAITYRLSVIINFPSSVIHFIYSACTCAFSSSVTPHSTTKVHPVMSKLQAHMALAAIQNQQSSNNKLKHRPNTGSSQEFSPPSQIVSNYANYETATRIPLWHHGFPAKGHGSIAHNGDFHHHVHKPEAQVHQQILPSVHPSIITPFLEQVHLKQKEVAAAAEQKNSFKQSHESSSLEANGSFEVVNDVFSKHLVPPPPSTSKTHYKQKVVEKVEKYPKLNLSMQSPLQDASRFNYNNVISTSASSTTSTESPFNWNQDIQKYRPSYSENIHVTTEKPNVFVNLNRSKENPYKHHKLLHPSYTGGLKKKPDHDKPFLPTPYKPSEKEEEIKIDYEPQHSYFTIEDAVTPHFPDSLKYDHHEGSDELEIITLRPQVRPTTTVAPTQRTTSTTTIPFVEATNSVESPSSSPSSPRPRQKLRRRKPKPQNQQVNGEHQQQHENISEKPLRTRGNVRNNSTTATPETELKTRNKLNHPNRVRTRPNLTSSTPAATSSSDYDYTFKPIDEELRRSEIVTTASSTQTTTSKSIESSEQPDAGIRHRVRLRYKNKLNAKINSLEGIDFKPKQRDSQISDSENENIVVKQPSVEYTTEFNVVTENPFAEIKSSLKLPNLKLRNEAFTTIPTTAETVSSSISSIAAEHDENNAIQNQQKVANRPRFSIKELKRKQYLTSSSALPSAASTTVLTSSSTNSPGRPDSQRFNRYRLNLNRRRNETNDFSSSSSEEIDTTRKRYSSTRFSTSSSPLSSTSATTVDNTVQQSSTKRTILPKRTFTPRNFTKPSSTNNGDNEVALTSLKPTIRNSTSNRPSTPGLRQRIHNYNKKKDSSNEVLASEPDDSIKNFDTIITHEQPLSTTTIITTTSTSTELPITRETSIMKIAKTPSSIVNQSIKTTTINSNSVIENTLLSSPTNERHDSTDLVGSPSEHSQRVAELTISANENSAFKSANIGLLSRRIPNYFTISTDDPILPIQAFFPQIKTNESVS